jgi:hypothetical protein
VQCRDDLRTLTRRRGDPLDRAAAYVADCENAWQIGFERTLLMIAGTNEALVVERDTGADQPVSIGFETDEQEQMADRAGPFITGKMGTAADRLQHSISAIERTHRRVVDDFDVRGRGDTLDQIARHARN